MKPPITIKRILGVFLFCVFALGITPKQVLHDVLTNHIHSPVKETTSASVSKDRFSCDEENLVAESPFVEQHFSIQVSAPSFFLTSRGTRISSYTFLRHFFFELRGPPSLA